MTIKAAILAVLVCAWAIHMTRDRGMATRVQR